MKTPLFPFTLAILFLASCSGPKLTMLDRPLTSTKTTRTLTNSTALTSENRATMKSEDLLSDYRRQPEAAIQSLAVLYNQNPTEARRQALAELCSDQGDRLTANAYPQAIGYYLDAASLTEERALNAPTESESVDRTLYNYCVARIARLLRQQASTGSAEIVAPGPLTSHRFRLGSGAALVDPRQFDALVPASWLKPAGIKWVPIKQEGFGVAMVGHLEQTPERKAADPMMPSTGHALALNASLRFGNGSATLRLQDLMQRSDGEINGRRLPLAGDFTAPLTFVYYKRNSSVSKFMATIRPDHYQQYVGLYSAEPFRPNKTSLILVHGLLSTAEGWLPFLNLLRADPVVRENYQIILFNYPTGTSVTENAAKLRRSLADFRQFYDPQKSNRKMRDMFILGHSMGGILSNWQIRDSGDLFYQSVFARPLEELDMSEETKREIREIGFFEANPDIKRALFIAAPHRGSNMASSPIGRLGAWLIRMPLNLVDAALDDLNAPGVLTESARAVQDLSFNSVTSLRPDNPVLEGALRLPVKEGVRMHSIIAQKDPDDALEASSDGVVPYTSAHLSGVESEFIVVDANHTSVLERNDCIQEVWRILRLHLEGRRG